MLPIHIIVILYDLIRFLGVLASEFRTIVSNFNDFQCSEVSEIAREIET